MAIVIYALLAVIGVLAFLAVTLLVAELKVVNQLMDTNKRLLIVVAGRDGKAETLRALVASAKPPQKPLKGIADGKKGEKPANTDYTMTIGLPQ